MFDKGLSCTALILTAAFKDSQRFATGQLGMNWARKWNNPISIMAKTFSEDLRGGIFQSLNEMMEYNCLPVFSTKPQSVEPVPMFG